LRRDSALEDSARGRRCIWAQALFQKGNVEPAVVVVIVAAAIPTRVRGKISVACAFDRNIVVTGKAELGVDSNSPRSKLMLAVAIDAFHRVNLLQHLHPTRIIEKLHGMSVFLKFHLVAGRTIFIGYRRKRHVTGVARSF
jgi:hypothetical protein